LHSAIRRLGGLPERMHRKLVEPLRELFKDEVRELGLPPDLVNRHPFPGPGVAIRIPGNITKEKPDLLRKVDTVYIDEIRKAGRSCYPAGHGEFDYLVWLGRASGRGC